MAIVGLHHFNLRVGAPELADLEKFYCEVVGLRIGPRPPFQSAGNWLYAGNIPLLHITQMHSGETVAPGSPQDLPAVDKRRSAVDHIAFKCSDLELHLERLRSSGISYTITEVPDMGEIQIFCRDPSGTGVELIFAVLPDPSVI